MKVFEVLQENFISNLVGDVRNAFKPGIAVTPNMIAELEDGLARLKRGEQPTPRQQKIMDTFMSTTMAREIKKTFGVDIEEDNMPNAADRPRDPRVIRNMPNAAADDVNPAIDYINALKDPNVDPEWLEVLRKMAYAYTGQDIEEGILDYFSRGSDASGLNNIGNMIGKTQADGITVARKAQELLDQGMPQQEIIRALQQEFGVNPRAARNAISYAEAGLLEETEWGNMDVGDVASILEEAGRELGLKGRYLYAWRRFALDAFSKIAARQYAEENRELPPVEEGKLKSKSYKKSLRAAKASGRRRMKHLRDSQENNAAQATVMLSKIDMALDGSGLKRQGFELVKDPNSFTRGSITREAEIMIRNWLAKAKAMGAELPPAVDPRPTVNPADIDDKEFEGMYETATSGATSVGGGNIASVSNPSVTRNAKKPKKTKGVAPNALDSGANLMTGQVLKR